MYSQRKLCESAFAPRVTSSRGYQFVVARGASWYRRAIQADITNLDLIKFCAADSGVCLLDRPLVKVLQVDTGLQ